eukprot:g63218.t1
MEPVRVHLSPGRSTHMRSDMATVGTEGHESKAPSVTPGSSTAVSFACDQNATLNLTTPSAQEIDAPTSSPLANKLPHVSRESKKSTRQPFGDSSSLVPVDLGSKQPEPKPCLLDEDLELYVCMPCLLDEGLKLYVFYDDQAYNWAFPDNKHNLAVSLLPPSYRCKHRQHLHLGTRLRYMMGAQGLVCSGRAGPAVRCYSRLRHLLGLGGLPLSNHSTGHKCTICVCWRKSCPLSLSACTTFLRLTRMNAFCELQACSSDERMAVLASFIFLGLLGLTLWMLTLTYMLRLVFLYVYSVEDATGRLDCGGLWPLVTTTAYYLPNYPVLLSKWWQALSSRLCCASEAWVCLFGSSLACVSFPSTSSYIVLVRERCLGYAFAVLWISLCAFCIVWVQVQGVVWLNTPEFISFLVMTMVAFCFIIFNPLRVIPAAEPDSTQSPLSGLASTKLPITGGAQVAILSNF